MRNKIDNESIIKQQLKNMSKDFTTNLKVAILHAFFKSDCKGGGEKLIFAMRNYYKAVLYAGAIDLINWNPNQKSDSFVQALWDPQFVFKYLAQDSQIPVWKKIKRQLFFRFSPMINELNDFDVVFFSGNIALAQGRINGPKKILYCHTTPRPFTDQLDENLSRTNWIIKPFFRFFARWVVAQYTNDCKKMDLIVSNSTNIQNRLKTFTGLDSIVIYPAVDTSRFNWLEQGDYFISYARLESIKRIELIVEAFAQMPDQKIIFCSTGPLKSWLANTIAERGLTNITFEGLVSDERLQELVGGARAGIYIPVNEDAGITQIEIMAAGKPVIGVNEGALPDTVLHDKTGLIIAANPTVGDLKNAVIELTPEKAMSMKEACIKHAKNYDQSVFFDKMNIEIEKLFDKSDDIKR
jgi:glycosyltransferase involved in cell wall biosynthesis